jgi:hypothetical protein
VPSTSGALPGLVYAHYVRETAEKKGLATEVFLDAQGLSQNPAVLRVRVAKKERERKTSPPGLFLEARRGRPVKVWLDDQPVRGMQLGVNVPLYEPRLATETGLEFIMGQIAELPTGRQLMQFAGWVLLGLCVIALVRLRMWDRYIGGMLLELKKQKAAAVSRLMDRAISIHRRRAIQTGRGIRLIGRLPRPHLHLSLPLSNG